MAEFFDDGLLYAGSNMVAKRATEIIQCAVRGEPYARPTVVNGEPAVISQDISEWDGMTKWLSNSPAAEMEKARNRGNIGDMLAIRYAEEGWLDIKDSGEWAVQCGIDNLMTFDQEDVRWKAGVFSTWWAHAQPKPIAWQLRVSNSGGWAGTLDMLASINNDYYLLDWKFGKYSVTYKEQISAYRFCDTVHVDDPKTASAFLEVLSNSRPALVCVGEDRVQFRPLNNVGEWYKGFRDSFSLYQRLEAKEDSPPCKLLSYSPDMFEKAQL